MFKNYIKITFRNIVKNKSFSILNIAGLSIGITVFVLISLFTQYEFSYDEFHKDGDRIYRMLRVADPSDGAYKIAVTSGPFAPTIKNDYPNAVDDVIRVYPSDGLVSYGEKKFYENNLYLVDQNFFEFFSFDLIQGDKHSVLNGPNKAVISDLMAEKYFGHDDPIGKIIEVDNNTTFEVTGVFNSNHPNSHINFDFVGSLSTFEGSWLTDGWWNNGLFTYLKLAPNVNPAQFNEQLDNFINKYFAEDFRETNRSLSLTLEPIQEIYLNSDTRYDEIPHGSKDVNLIFSIVALFVLIIASINFMNLSSAKAARRAQEIGIRKVVGAEKRNLILQFISESTIYSFIAGVISLAVVVGVLPSFNNFVGKDLFIPFDNPFFYIYSILFLVLLGILSGSYPAFVLSNFRPVKVLKSEKPREGNGTFRKVLVVTQFVISVILISGVIVIYNQTEFLVTKDPGFQKEQVLLIRLNNNEIEDKRFELRDEFKRLSSVENVSFMSGEPGGFHDNYAFKIEERGGQFVRMRSLVTDYEYIPTFDIKLRSGRNFSTKYSQDSTRAVIINESAAKSLGWTPEEALGKRMSIRFYNVDQYRQVVGVIEDYHFLSLHKNIEPLVIFPGDDHRVMAVKTQATDLAITISEIQAVYNYKISGFPLRYEFLDKTFEANYKSEKKQLSVISLLTMLAIIVSSLGLLGLVTHSTELRKKEIGIRKVLGASVESVASLLVIDLMKLVLIANLIAIPVSWLIAKYWLSNFAYQIDLTVWPFILTAAATLLIAAITTGFQTIKAALIDPVKIIKYE